VPPAPPPPAPTDPPPRDWWDRFIDRVEDALGRPFVRTMAWLATIALFVALGYLWYELKWYYLADEVEPRAAKPARPIDFTDAGGPVRFLVVWTEPFFDFLFAYPLFPLTILFFWLVSWGGLGRGLGIPDLVWPEGWWQRFWVGVAVSLLFANLLFVRYMLETGGTLSGPNFGHTPTLLFFEPPGSPVRQLGGYLFWTLVPCLLIFYVPKIASPTYRRLLRQGAWIPATGIGLVAGVALTAAAFWVDSHYNFSATVSQQEPFLSLFERKRVVPAERELHLRSLIMAGIPITFLAVFLFQSRFGAVWSPVWSVCLVIGLASSVYGAIAFYLSGLQFFVLAGLIAVAWICNRSQPYKMSFPAMERYRRAPGAPPTHKPNGPLPRVDLDVPPPESPPEPITARELLKAFAENWKTGPGAGTDTLPKLVLVATTGGGIRAAVWTAAVLEGLEEELPGDGAARAAFRDHIRLFTGASGGMLGAALYAADFERPPEAKSPEKLSAMLARDGLWATIQTMVFNDLPSMWLPGRIRWDRGRSLEAAWHDNTRPYATNADRPSILRRAWLHLLRKPLGPPSPLERTFATLREAEAQARRPSLLFSPMLVEDCRRVLISNLEVGNLTRTLCPSLNNPANTRTPPELQSIGAIDFFAHFPEVHETFRVGTAARMSATFPFVTPGVSLPTDPPRRVVDAGYFDNFGVNLAALWLLENRDAVEEFTSGVVLVEVRAYPRRVEKVQFRDIDGTGDLLTWGLSEVSTPAEAVLNLYARG
ncbi:MAG TPA: patatin-like phospholipase family protein, partial [Gemmata sp.]|nr:patatin-like phospholipase family protein [Gemmata sp.]